LAFLATSTAHRVVHVRILLTGSSGMIGRNLGPLLRGEGHEVVRLLRHPPSSPQADGVVFDPATPESLDGFDAVVHLAGENVGRRWTARRKACILASRADFTRVLCETLAKSAKPPGHFLSASAVGYYGYHRDIPLTEEAASGDGFLAEVCRAWEGATAPLAGLRVVHMRLATVLSPQGGALAKLLPSFRFGVGAVMGSGAQMMSWIALPDLLEAIGHMLRNDALRGAVNVASPHPVSNREFSKKLGGVLHRPVLLKIPAAALKLAFGQMASETILASQKAVPAKLEASGFTFGHPRLLDALTALLER
jgi:uncharacterized protein (TIGR01777 family)